MALSELNNLNDIPEPRLLNHNRREYDPRIACRASYYSVENYIFEIRVYIYILRIIAIEIYNFINVRRFIFIKTRLPTERAVRTKW